MSSADARGEQPRHRDRSAGTHAVVKSRAEIEQWLVRAIARSLQLEPSAIDRDRRLEEFGMDSVAAVELSGDLETWLGKPVAPTIVWDYPTIAQLAAALAV